MTSRYSFRETSAMTISGQSPLLWGAVLLMIATRLALVSSIEVSQWSDLAWYYKRAVELVQTGRYAEDGVSTAFWPVGYPAFLAAVLSFTTVSERAGQLANIALSVICLLLLHRWCMQRFGDRRTAGVAALLLALYPNHMGYSAGLYSEPLFTALLLLLFLLARPHASVARMAAAGCVAGAATLVKAQTLMLGPILLLVLCVPELSWSGMRSALWRCTIGVLFMAAAVAPWTWRNWQTLGAPVIVSSNGGMSLLAGNNPSMTTSLRDDFNDRDPLVSSVRFSVADQVAADRRARAAAWNWIGENPERFVALMPKKLFRLWVPDGETEWLFQAGYEQYERFRSAFRTVRALNQLYYLSLLIGFAFAWRHWTARRDPTAWAVPIMIAFFSALSMVFSGQSRYHAPLMPFIIGYAAWTLVGHKRIGKPK